MNLFNFSAQPFSKRLLILTGLLVASLVVFLSATSIYLLKPNPTLAIKSVQTKQVSSIVAGGQPVAWSAFVKVQDIKNNSYLLKLPKNAGNIKTSRITKKQASLLLNAPKTQQLSLNQRATLALARNNTIKPNFLFADLDNAVSTVVQDVTDAVSSVTPPPSVDLSQTPDISTTASPSDLSAEASTDSASAEASADEVVKVDFTTPAPTITEQPTDSGKLITVSAQDSQEDPATPLTDVIASTKIPKIFKVGQESEIRVMWRNQKPMLLPPGPRGPRGDLPGPGGPRPDMPPNRANTANSINAPTTDLPVTFTAYDTDNDGYIDYLEWTVPHLSNQTYQIIYASKAFQLDQNQNILSDAYAQIKDKDNQFITIPQNNYIRVTFEKPLTNKNDLTIWAESTDQTQQASIYVYPVYTDSNGNQTEGSKLSLVPDNQNPDFTNITTYKKYRVLLKNLKTQTDTFDLRVTSNSIDFDQIIDPDAYSSYSILYSFGATGTDGEYPYSGLTLSGSTLYGTTYHGGENKTDGYSDGTIFKINTDGTGYSKLYDFGATPTDGENSYGIFTLSGSTLYGTTYYGGANGVGTVFKINTDGTGYSKLYDFGATPTDGEYPYSGLTLSGSTLYGTTYEGGENKTDSAGTIFKINTDGTGYSKLYDFGATPTDGEYPYSGLTLSGSTLYGTTYEGGENKTDGYSDGTIFKINTDGTGYSKLYDFGATPTDGEYPYGIFTLSGSTLYGTTYEGGENGVGTVFKINTDGTGYSKLYDFGATPTDGEYPYSGLTLSGSTLYGTTGYGGANTTDSAGTIFKINTDGTGYSKLYDFGATPTDGEYPSTSLTLSGSTLYGATYYGGENKTDKYGYGTVFSLTLPNNPPSFESVSSSPSSVTQGSPVTFTAASSDPDQGDTLNMYVCKSNDFTGTSCGSSGEWCDSSATPVTTNPSCTYTSSQSDSTGSNTYYAYIIDSHGLASVSNPQTSTFTISAPPAPTPPRLSGGSGMLLFNITHPSSVPSQSQSQPSTTVTPPASPSAIALLPTLSLKPGDSSTDVKLLQQFLSTIPGIYPAGIINGRFGPLTKQAVIAFQLKYKLITSPADPAAGYVGPKTRAEMADVVSIQARK